MQASTFNFSTQAQDQAQALTPAQYNALSDSWFGPAMPQADSPWDFSNQDQDQDQDQTKCGGFVQGVLQGYSLLLNQQVVIHSKYSARFN